ncbi:MAG: 6-phosphofructokinase [Endomicrobiales bacterium]|nr:6-phosphofructokinase [Endomicrobiales bacterium]
MKRIAVITSGGDAPGMNAAIRAVVREALFLGIEVYGVQRGFRGLLENQVEKLSRNFVSGILDKGGTILKTGRCPQMRTKEGLQKAVNTLKNLSLDGLVVIGGDGSLAAGTKISQKGIPVVCIPGSIDNDVFGTDETIGFDTALDTAMRAIDKIRDTAASHERVFVVEVMGREHGFLALAIGISSGADLVIIPEIKPNIPTIAKGLKAANASGKTSIIVVYAEGAGNSMEFTKQLENKSGLEVRLSSLGYIQRGGSPSARSRILASQFGAYAVRLLKSGAKNRLVVLQNGKVSNIPLSIAIKNEKKLDMNLYKLATELSF